MSFKVKLFCCTCLISVGLSDPSAYAQDVGGIINLMGRMIEQDMHNQQQRRRQESEQRAYRAQQQAAQRQEQARIDEQRKQEILLIRRLQTALSKLGFYTSKVDGDRGPGTLKAEQAFMRAYEWASITPNEDTISHLEGLADMGFQSLSEMEDALESGFESRSQYVKAKEGGFESAADYTAARNEGFQSFKAFKSFKLSGFKDASEFRLASDNGFTAYQEYQEAKSAGFTERAIYLDFRSSGHQNKASYDQEKSEIAAAQKATASCQVATKQDDLSAAFNICLEALISAGKRTGMAEPLKVLQKAFEQKRLEFEQHHQTGQSVAVASIDATNSAGPTNAANFLVEKSQLDHIDQQLKCAFLIAEASWAEASKLCAALAQADSQSPTLIKLAQYVSTQAKTEAENQAKLELEQRQAAAKEEQRLALAAAQERMATLLTDMAGFTQTNSQIAKPLEIAKALVRLRQLSGSDDVSAIEQALASTYGLLNEEPQFQKYVDEKQKASEVATLNARTTATAELKRMSAFVEAFIAKNLLHDAVSELLLLQEKMVAALASGQDSQIFNVQKSALSELHELELSRELDSFIYEENQAFKTEVQQADNGLAVTDANRALLEGNAQDVLILGNFTPNAPHLLLNLLGNVTFDQGTANACWISEKTDEMPLRDFVLAALKGLGAINIVPNGFCQTSNSSSADVLIIERSALLKQNILDVQPIIDGFEATDLRIVQAVLWDEVGKSAQSDRELSATIRQEVLGNAREGYGIVHFDNQSSQICMVVDEADFEFHNRALAIRQSDLDRSLPRERDYAAMSLDRAFAAFQKRACGAIYASQTDMAKLLEGLDKIKATHSVAPIWIDNQLIAEGKTLSLRSQEEKQREIAERRQKLEADRALNAAKGAEAETIRANADKELKARYSQEAKAAHNDLAELIKSVVDGNGGKSSHVAALFPAVWDWNSDRLSDGWVTETYGDVLIDYGTADWQGRKLEAVVVKSDVKLKNAVRGEYADECFLLGYLIDSEFNMRRDPITLSCADGDKLATWQTSRSFVSRWVAR